MPIFTQSRFDNRLRTQERTPLNCKIPKYKQKYAFKPFSSNSSGQIVKYAFLSIISILLEHTHSRYDMFVDVHAYILIWSM